MIPESELKIIAGEKLTGGQTVGLVSAKVRMIHIPTGIEVSCNHLRSQMRNKECCLRMIEEALTNPELQIIKYIVK